MISIFTPTHDASFLLDAHESLRDQRSLTPRDSAIACGQCRGEHFPEPDQDLVAPESQRQPGPMDI